MAYNLRDRFPQPPKRFRIFEPGAYQNDDLFKVKPNKVSFLSKNKRITGFSNPIWTHAMYHADQPPKITTCSSMMSKCPRFPYEALSKEDIEAILCNCGIQNVCECSEEKEQETEISCQGKAQRKLFKGAAPRSAIQDGLGAPSRRDYGFEILPDGTHERIFIKEKDTSPPFYDAHVYEATAFYQGCKWSQWKSPRTVKPQEERPGPSDYNLEKEPTYEEVCAEKVRAYKRKTSKQLRFIENIQRKDLLEARPGPAHYNPRYPKGTDLKKTGPRTARFQESEIEHWPGPADHWIKRDFEPSKPPLNVCHAKLSDPAFFGIKATRFKPRIEEGPSPATYSLNDKFCNVLHCNVAAFGSSSPRFHETTIDNDEENDVDTVDDQTETAQETCPTPTWEFKSKTIRIQPLTKEPRVQSPANVSMSSLNVERPEKLQYQCPFYSSEGRFQPWFDWISVIGKLKTPGPGYYNTEKPRCLPAVCQGPLYRTDRFPPERYLSPAPNEYNVGGGVENILDTCNQRLKNNIQMKHKFVWNPLKDKKLSLEEQETMLLNKSIALLDVDADDVKQDISAEVTNQRKPKMLRSFLYSHPIGTY